MMRRIGDRRGGRRGVASFTAVAVFWLGLMGGGIAQAGSEKALAVSPGAGFQSSVKAAMAAPTRPEKDRARDANRKPVETLSFFGVDHDDRVLEILPGGGWYSRLLGPALRDAGKLYLAFAGRTPKALFEEPGMDRIEVLEENAPFSETDRKYVYDVPPFDFGVQDLDVVLTFRNLHNLTEEARLRTGRAAFAALRPGGVYGVIDHTRRHNETGTDANWRRLDPVQVIAEVQSLGFVFEAASDLHARPEDALKLEVGDKSVTGRTDRFTLRFRKPAR